jgi:hypothetical protein
MIETPDINAQVILEQPNFEEFIQRGQELREKADNLQWEFGDLALDFTRLMGTKFLPDLARGIGVKIATLRRYRDVSAAFPLQLRQAFPYLSWSHFREVAGNEDRNLLLTRAHDENWSVEKLGVMAKPKKEDIIDDGKAVPPKPELSFDTELRLWFIANAKEDARHLKANLVQE